MSGEETAEALSVRIAYAVRAVRRSTELFLAAPITTEDLVALWTDPKAAWEEKLAAIPWAAAATARAAYARLVELVGAEGSVLDHGWGNGGEQIGVRYIGEEVATMDSLLAPLAALRKSLQRRVAA